MRCAEHFWKIKSARYCCVTKRIGTPARSNAVISEEVPQQRGSSFINFIGSWNPWFIGSLIHWVTDLLIHGFTDSLVQRFIDSFSQLCMDSLMSWRWCTSQLHHFTASAFKRRSYRPPSSYSHSQIFETSAPARTLQYLAYTNMNCWYPPCRTHHVLGWIICFHFDFWAPVTPRNKQELTGKKQKLTGKKQKLTGNRKHQPREGKTPGKEKHQAWNRRHRERKTAGKEKHQTGKEKHHTFDLTVVWLC